MMDCEVYEWSNVDMVLVEGEGDIKCEICHVVMEGKGYLQVCGKDICDLLEETLVVKIWRY